MKIIILDYNNGETYIFPYDENIYDNAEDFFESEYCKERGLKESNCNYMVVHNLKINVI